MSLDSLVDIGESRPPQTLKIKGKQAKFLFGIKYVPITYSSKPLFELVYERPDIGVHDILIVNLLKIIGYEDSRDSNSGIPYILNTSSLEELNTNSIEPKRDYRYILFGSRAVYKSFFNVLNEKRLSGSISKEDYQKVYDRIQFLFEALHNEVKSTKNLFVIVGSIKHFIKEFERDEIIAPYLEEAKLRIPYKLH